jgi:hypothetical protein
MLCRSISRWHKSNRVMATANCMYTSLASANLPLPWAMRSKLFATTSSRARISLQAWSNGLLVIAHPHAARGGGG